MNTSDAEDLAVRISQTWPGGLGADMWLEDIRDLDAGRVGTTLVKLRRERVKPPTVAEFLARYAQIDTARPVHPDCSYCANHGWKTLWATTTDGHEYSPGVEPCHCQWGDDRRPAHRTAIEANTNELDRLFPHRHQPKGHR